MPDDAEGVAGSLGLGDEGRRYGRGKQPSWADDDEGLGKWRPQSVQRGSPMSPPTEGILAAPLPLSFAGGLGLLHTLGRLGEAYPRESDYETEKRRAFEHELKAAQVGRAACSACAPCSAPI